MPRGQTSCRRARGPAQARPRWLKREAAGGKLSIAAANGGRKPKFIVLAPPAGTKTNADQRSDGEGKSGDARQDHGEATKTAKPVALVAKDKTELGATEHYLRAQPVNAADLVEAPEVRTVPPVAPPPAQPPEKRARSAEADPNSLGAPLNPLRPMLAPPAAEHASTRRSGSSGPSEWVSKPIDKASSRARRSRAVTVDFAGDPSRSHAKDTMARGLDFPKRTLHPSEAASRD